MSFMDLVKFAEEREGKVRSFYDAETLGIFTGDALAEMILMNAEFVVVLLLQGFDRETFWDTDDGLYRLRNLFQDLQRDLALLENQLSLFILNELFYKVQPVKSLNYSFQLVSVAVWNDVLSPEIEIPRSACYLVDMLKLYHEPTDPMKQPKADFIWSRVVYPRSIIELHEAGIRLKKSTSTKFTDIRYVNGILEILHIAITDRTESYLQNIVALEQCHCIKDRYVIDYVSLILRLVNTPEDVEHLIENEILDN